MNFRRIAANLSVDMKEWTRNKATIFWTLAFPILLILLFGFIFTGEGETTYDLPIQDNDGGFWATNLTGDYVNSEQSCLVSPVIDDIAQCDPGKDLHLKFWHWYRFEEGYDGANVQVWFDGDGGVWKLIHPVDGYPGNIDLYNGPDAGFLYGQPGYVQDGTGPNATPGTWNEQDRSS